MKFFGPRLRKDDDAQDVSLATNRRQHQQHLKALESVQNCRENVVEEPQSIPEPHLPKLTPLESIT
ncbi:Protein of unknown function [Gryllus bimaculatus]|nr:Protein of unknown function [Gryllus bimaculatus]